MSASRVLIVICLAASLLMIGVGMIVALLPQRVLDLSGSMQSVSYLASVFALSYLLSQMPIGNLSDRFGAKTFLVFGYIFCSLSGLMFFAAESAEAIFLGRFVQGIGEAPVWALGPALLSLAYPHAKGKVIGLYNASIHAGLTAGPLLGILLAQERPEISAFLLFAGLCLCAGMIVLAFLPSTGTASLSSLGESPRLKELGQLLTVGGPLRTLCGVLLYGAGYGIFISVLPAYLALSQDFDQTATGILFALFYVATSISQLIAGPLSDRHGRHAYMISGLLCAAIGYSTFPFLTYPLVYVPLALASFGLGVFCVSSLAYLNDSVPHSLKASVSSCYYLAWGLGYFAGPLVIGIADGLVGPTAGYTAFATLVAVQAAVLWHHSKSGGGKSNQV